jgi:hypothetical protein
MKGLEKSVYWSRGWLVNTLFKVLKALSVSAFQIKGVLFFSKLVKGLAVLLKFGMKRLQ